MLVVILALLWAVVAIPMPHEIRLILIVLIPIAIGLYAFGYAWPIRRGPPA